jgi:Rrf2 family transcriptional repressor of oqxAB
MLSLTLAAREGIETMSSTELAEGLAANPSLVRRLIAPLVHAKLLDSNRGKQGGVGLARSPSQITLADIYRAVHASRKVFSQRTEVPHRCVVSANIDGLVSDVDAEVSAAMLGSLRSRTLERCLQEMEASAKGTAHRRRRSGRITTS